MSRNQSWGVVTLGLVVGIFGSVVLMLMVRSWELSLRRKTAMASAAVAVPERLPTEVWDGQEQQASSSSDKIMPLHDPETMEALTASRQEIEQLHHQLNEQSEEIQRLIGERTQLQQQLENTNREISSQHEQRRHHLEEQDTLLGEYKETINEQRTLLDQRQQRIHELEERVHDLHYEVKTLLKLGELSEGIHNKPVSHPVLDTFADNQPQHDDGTGVSAADSQIHTPFDAQQQLARCVAITSEVQGAAHLAGSSKLGALSAESNAIDLRRLSDALRNESAAPLFLYSPEHHKIVLANNLIKGLLGYSPERFTSDFRRLVQQGWNEWQNALTNATQQGSAQAPVILKTRSGHDVLVHIHLEKVPEGIFEGYLLAVMAQQ